MHTFKNILLIIAIVAVVLGSVLFLLGFAAGGWSFRNLNNADYEVNSYTLQGDFDNISIEGDEANITFLTSEDGTTRVVCNERIEAKHRVEIVGGVLTIGMVDEKEWIDHFVPFDFTSPSITVYLPKNTYSELKIFASTGKVTIPAGFTFASVDIAVSTGDIALSSISCDNLKLKLSTGDVCITDVYCGTAIMEFSTGSLVLERVRAGNITHKSTTGDAKIKDVTCADFKSSATTGDLKLEKVIAERLDIVRGTGDVSFLSCDANDISVETSTGEVWGSFLTDKIFLTKTSTGDIDVPSSTVGGRCEISTGTGDVELWIER